MRITEQRLWKRLEKIMRFLRIDKLDRENEIKRLRQPRRRRMGTAHAAFACLVIISLSGCASKTPIKQVIQLPPMPPMAKFSAPRLATIAPKPLVLKWDFVDFERVEFRIYSRSSFTTAWSLKATTTTNSFSFLASGPSEFFKVSAIRDGVEIFATK